MTGDRPIGRCVFSGGLPAAPHPGSKVFITENGGLFPGVFARTSVEHGLLIGAELPSEDGRLKLFGELPEAEESGASGPNGTDPARLAAIFYTTGSTFDPKG